MDSSDRSGIAFFAVNGRLSHNVSIQARAPSASKIAISRAGYAPFKLAAEAIMTHNQMIPIETIVMSYLFIFFVCASTF